MLKILEKVSKQEKQALAEVLSETKSRETDEKMKAVSCKKVPILIYKKLKYISIYSDTKLETLYTLALEKLVAEIEAELK